MAAVRHRENGFLPLPCPGQAEENYLDAAGADAGRCAGDRWGGGCQWHERWEESSSGPGGAAGAQSAHKGGAGPFRAPPPLWFGWPGGQRPPGRQTPPPPRAAGAFAAAKRQEKARPHALWGRAHETLSERGEATVSPPGQSPGPWPTGPGGGNRPPRATCPRASAAAVARLPTCAQHRRPRRANLRVAPPCAQHLKDLLGAGDDVVLGLAGKHVEEGGIACHPDDQIPVLFRMDLGVQ